MRLADIAASARLIGMYVQGGVQPFLESTMAQEAVIRQLELMGEAAGNVSEELRKSHPEVPWRAMRGFSSFAKHEYWRLDLKLVWKAAQDAESIRVAVDRIRSHARPR